MLNAQDKEKARTHPGEGEMWAAGRGGGHLVGHFSALLEVEQCEVVIGSVALGFPV